MLRLSATMGPFSRRSSSSVVLLMNKDGIVFTSSRWGLGEDVISPPIWCRKSSLVLSVNEDVKPKQVVVVVETSNVFLDHVVNVFVAAQYGFDHNILYSTPERFRVLSAFSQPSPQLVHWPLVILEKNFDNVSCSRYLAARRVVAKKLCILVDGEVGQVNQRVAQVFRL